VKPISTASSPEESRSIRRSARSGDLASPEPTPKEERQ
jgi:hypothetical protein